METKRRDIVARLERYIKTYNEQVSEDNAQPALDEFEEQWSELVPYVIDSQLPGHRSMYSSALIIYSVATYFKRDLTEKDVLHLSELISDFDGFKDTQYFFSIKESLYFNLGRAWHKLGRTYHSQTVTAFKMHVYYLVVMSNHTSYHPTAYAYKKCDKFLYQALTNEELHLASPATFNDPFDCPIYELLHNRDEIASLIRKAYQDCLKIACFTSNKTLPKLGSDGLVVSELKSNNSTEEFLNPLMWAHYADSHRGICIKYKFPNSMSELGDINSCSVSYFKDVKYSDKELLDYSGNNSITLENSFFLKGEAWRYENELRFLQFDLNGLSEHKSISIPNCIEAIYFGLKCSEQDQQTIRNIMKDKIFKDTDLKGNVISEKAIQFYLITIDQHHFGRIVAEEVSLR